jgi:hypothetical protein
MFVPGKPNLHSLMFIVKNNMSEAPFRYSTLELNSGLIPKHYIRLLRPAMENTLVY